MKKVQFGTNQVIIVENISKYLLWPSSFIENLIKHREDLSIVREYYIHVTRSDNIYKLYQICDTICVHEDVYHVDILIKHNTDDLFVTDMTNMMQICFDSVKSCTFDYGDTNMFFFRDGFSNPSLSIDNFQIKENWDNDS